jgi:hypothetical protein
MNRKLMRWTLLGLIALVALAALAPALLKAAGITITRSTDTGPHKATATLTEGWCKANGVAIVVDFGAGSGKPAVIRCLASFRGTGWQALEQAGLKPAGTAQYAVGFVCRLANFPPQSRQDCANTPTYAQGVWSYYIAGPRTGNHWMFSGSGAASRKPECGSVEGWVFITEADSANRNGPSTKPQTRICDSK